MEIVPSSQPLMSGRQPGQATRRSLALPHRAMRASAVNRLHTATGLLALMCVGIAAFLMRAATWQWQIATWSRLLSAFGISAKVSGYRFGWDQQFLSVSGAEILLGSFAMVLVAYLIMRAPVAPTVKGLFVVTAVPLFLYGLVVYLVGSPPAGALDHVGPEWLYGELVLWVLIPVLYAVFVFPLPFSLLAKLTSLATVLLMSVAWRTITPVVYVLIALHSQGLLAISAWMILGPWADYLYVVPVFSATLILYKGGRPGDYRT